MKTIDVPPDPGLLESMRSIGYTIESAIADIVDNSISAGAHRVEVRVSATGPFQIAVVDDGVGMTREQAIDAMRLAATGPSASRRENDLGRFGLGLKTASLSQCRTLTVVSIIPEGMTALRWSLDHVSETGTWSLIELSRDDLTTLLGFDQLVASGWGTLVHWGDLDQLAMTEGSSQRDLDEVAIRVKDHIALVFHLFNSQAGGEVTFVMNGGTIAPIDPFMERSKLTSATPWESINVDGQIVRLMAYTLPYLSRLDPADRAEMLSLGGLRDTQGFYVYRGKRLVIWGTWFRVAPRSEMAKLTRVRVDIPNTLDHLWALDVKKSTADPPPAVRKRLGELARTMMAPSQRVQQFRGRKVDSSSKIDFMWNTVVNGDEFRYEINMGHPSVQAFQETLTDQQRQLFAILLDDIQATFPVEDAHNKMSTDHVPPSVDETEILERAARAWAQMSGQGVGRQKFIDTLAASEPYSLIPHIQSRLQEMLP